MKTSRIVISLLLAALMVAGLSVSAFAATAENVRQYKTYLCLGDSISAGCGVPFEEVNTDEYDASLDYWEQMYHGYDFEIVPGAYHSLVAEAIGAKLIQGGVSGNRSVEMRYLLDGVYNDCDDSGDWGKIFFKSDGSLEDTCAKLDEHDAALKARYGVGFKDAVKTAELITVNLGSNDVLSYSALFTMASLSDEEDGEFDLRTIFNKILKNGDIFGGFSSFLELADKAGRLNEAIATFAKCLVSSSVTFKTNYSSIVKYIYSVNPEADVVAAGIYNPFNHFRLSEKIKLKVGAVMDPVVADLNLFLKALEYSYKNYKYADCSATEIYDFNMDNVSAGDYVTKVHPTLKGHRYMAKQIISVLPEKAPMPFNDVPKTHWAYDEIEYVFDNGIMTGMTKTEFSPEKPMTRAEFATVIYRMAEGNAEGMEEPFKDVSGSHWAHDAIAWAYNKNIIKGYSQDLFGPDDNITRAQTVTMLYRYAGSPEVSGDLSMFKDGADVSASYRDAVIWAYDNGIVAGYPDGTFAPGAYTSRAQMAALIERYLTK